MRPLEVQLLRRWHAAFSEGLAVTPRVDLKVPPHGRPALVAPVWRASEPIVGVVLDCAAEPASER